jgi:hypothetical protein
LHTYQGSDNPAHIAFGVDPANSIAVIVYDEGQWRALGVGDRSVVPVCRGTSATARAWSGNQDLINNGTWFWEAGATPTAQPATAVPTSVAQTQPVSAARTPSSGTDAQPPQTLSVSGGDASIPFFGAGPALAVSSWAMRQSYPGWFDRATVLGHDGDLYSDWSAEALDQHRQGALPWPFCKVATEILPLFRKAGVSEEQIRLLTVANPRRLFERRGSD